MVYELDLKDKRILSELDKNSRRTFKQIGKKVRLSPEVVFHRMKKLESEGVIQRFQTISAISRQGFFAPKVYLKLQNMTKDTENEIRKYLINHNRIFWFGLCQGRWDLIIAYWSKTPLDFSNQLQELLNNFSQNISERQVTFGTNTIQYNNRWLLDKTVAPIETDFGSGLEEINLDEGDLEILKWLANNARMPVVEIAKRTGLTASIVAYKIKKLEKNKVIMGYKFQLNTHKIGYESCKSFVYFKQINDKKLAELSEFVKMNKNVINIVYCVGPWDMEIEFEVENFDQYYDLMEEIRDQFQDIIQTYDSVVFREEPKKSFVPDCYQKL